MDDILDPVLNYFKSRYATLVKSLSMLSLNETMILVIVVGSYLIFRPYLLKGVENAQNRQLDKIRAEDRKKAEAAYNLRGGKVKEAGTEEEEESEEGDEAKELADGESPAGSAARRRVKKGAAAEQLKQGGKSGKDIDELLWEYGGEWTDYTGASGEKKGKKK